MAGEEVVREFTYDWTVGEEIRRLSRECATSAKIIQKREEEIKQLKVISCRMERQLLNTAPTISNTSV